MVGEGAVDHHIHRPPNRERCGDIVGTACTPEEAQRHEGLAITIGVEAAARAAGAVVDDEPGSGDRERHVSRIEVVEAASLTDVGLLEQGEQRQAADQVGPAGVDAAIAEVLNTVIDGRVDVLLECRKQLPRGHAGQGRKGHDYQELVHKHPTSRVAEHALIPIYHHTCPTLSR